METLLESAKKVNPNREKLLFVEITPDHHELAVAWIQGTITYKQAATALGRYKGSGQGLGGTPYMLVRILKDGYFKGKVKIEIID